MTTERLLPEIGATLADLLENLGDVPPDRIPLRPPPGMATERDVIAARQSPERWLFELADGVLVLKPSGFAHSVLSAAVAQVVLNYLEERDLGVGFGAAAMYRLKPGLVRIPDFTFVSWERLPGGKVPDVEIAPFIPDLVVELPRRGHMPREGVRKLGEYFEAGARLVWVVHYPERRAEVFLSRTECTPVPEDGALDGGTVLPGLTVPLRALFARLQR